MNYLLDTDHISIFQRQSGAEYHRLASRIASHDPSDLALSVVSFHEQVLGCHTYISRATTASETVRGYGMVGRLLSDYAAVAVLSFDAPAAALLDGLLAQHIRIGTMDLRIASIALANRLILVTRNLNDFRRVPGLTIEDWTV